MAIGQVRRQRPSIDARTRSIIAPRLRLGVAIAFAAAIPFVSGLARDERVVLVGLMLGYAGATLLLEAVAARHPGFPARTTEALLGLAVIFVVTLVMPELQPAALVLYALGIAVYTTLGGPVLGGGIAVVAVAAAVIADALAPAGDEIGTALLLMVVALFGALVLVCDALTRRRRRRIARLARLHDALRAVIVTPDLQATLDSIVDSVVGALDATDAAVLLQEHGELAVASSSATHSWEHHETVGRAITRLQTVVVADAGEFAALVAVPLRLGGDGLGVLVAGFSAHGVLEHEDVALLEDYAEQAALVIVRAQAYEHERRAAEQRIEASQRKDEFLSMVSHELRTPLTAAKGFVDTVLLHWDRLPEERRRELLTRAAGNADELARLVDQLLDFTRVDTDGVDLDFRPIDLRPAIEQVLDDLEPVLAGHQVEVEGPPNLVITADLDAFTHVLVNLLTNAVKFSRPGSRIRISARTVDGEAVISVTDQGRGIPADEQQRIFDRFHQVGEDADVQRGTGIGLTIARRFVELHGGWIWVESAPGRGSTFSFTLPADRSRAVAGSEPATGVLGAAP